MLNENQIKNLRNYLKTHKITQEDFANTIGVTRQTILRYLNQSLSPKATVRKLINKITKIDMEN